MKKLYTLAFMALAATSVSASGYTMEVSKNIEGISAGTPAVETMAPSRIAIKDAATADIAPARRASKAKAPETSTDWKSIGEGTYLEDLLTIFSDVPANQMWKVDVETSASNPGWYRFLPYASGPVAELLGQPDTSNYLYLNASDPNKVYGLDFEAYGSFAISNYVPETEWDITADEAGYGTLADNCITFPTQSWVIYSSGWKMTTRNTGMKLFLPGAEVIDYSLKVSSHEWCSANNEISFTVTAGSSVAALKAVVIPGDFSMSDNNANIVATQGQEIPAGNITVDATEHGIHSLMVVALDADGNIQSKEAAYFFGTFENDDDWKSLGTGQFTEGIYAANYNDIDNETMDVEVQESKTTPGRYRLVNPYASHSSLGKQALATTEHGHNHYIYVDATVADRVFIEASPLGLDGPYGLAAVNSYGAKYAGTTAEADAKAAGFYGTYDAATRTISYPDDMILLGEKGYNNGSFLAGNTGTQLVLPESAGVDDIISDSNADAPVEYFNLQGVRVTNPAAGQLIIKRQGSEVTKMIVR